MREAAVREARVREAAVREVAVREAAVREAAVREAAVREARAREAAVRKVAPAQRLQRRDGGAWAASVGGAVGGGGAGQPPRIPPRPISARSSATLKRIDFAPERPLEGWCGLVRALHARLCGPPAPSADAASQPGARVP